MTDEVHSDGAAKRLPRHIQEEQVLTTAAGGSEMLVVLSTVSEDEVESVVEADAACIKGTDLGGGRPAMCAGEVVQERFGRAKEVAVLARAVARSVWTRLTVVMLIIVGRSGTTAMGCILAETWMDSNRRSMAWHLW